MSRSQRALPRRTHPAQLIAGAFALVIAVGTGLLMLPAATESGTPTQWVSALFSSTSAVCVTGLIVVETPEHWSTFGEVVLLCLFQIGGFGIMTSASLLGLLVARRIGLRMQRSIRTETKTPGLGDVRSVIRNIILISLTVEALTAVALATRFVAGYGEPIAHGIYLGIFHAVSAFNNAGFTLFSNSLAPFTTDPWICLPIVIAMIIGGLGFPVLFEIGRRLRGRRRWWSLHAKITLTVYAALVLVGFAAVTAFEWTNPATLGPLGAWEKLLVGLFHGTMPRSGGFNTVPVGEMHQSTLLVTDMLMFIGAGSAGTAGGIKVTTFALLAFVIATEIRAEPSVHVLGRKLPAEVQRQALAVALLGLGLVLVATLTLMVLSPFKLDAVLFEAVSAFGTVGLSTGITAELPRAGQLILVALMFTGRLGPITLASALALREHGRRYELPEERPIVG